MKNFSNEALKSASCEQLKELCDALRSEIISTDGSSSQINLAPYPSGVYIIEVTYGEDRQQKLTRRVIRR